MKKWILFLLAFSLYCHTEEPKKYTLSLCAIFKNEAKYLKEWIEYHRLVGVEHFYLYNNNSTDHYKRVLNPYVKKGVVTLIEWPDYLGDLQEKEAYKWAFSTQIPAYENAIHVHAKDQSKWLVFMEVNEFLVPAEEEKLTDLLKRYEDYDSVTLSSVFFDASKKDALPRKRLLIETVELTDQPKMNPQIGVRKMIIKPDQCVGFQWTPYVCVFEDQQKNLALDRYKLRINYYANRFVEGFLYLGKLKNKLHVDNRLLSDYDTRALLEEGFAIEDQERLICRFVPELYKRMGFNP